MNSCSEYELDDVVAITAIPLDNYNPWDGDIISPTIRADYFSPSLTDSIVIGISTPVAGGSLIPIVKKTGKAKDDPSVAVQGRRHTVNVDCQVDDRNPEVWPMLRKLENNAYHLLLSCRGKTRALVVASEHTYMCQVARDGAKTSVNFKIDSLSGLQLIV